MLLLINSGPKAREMAAVHLNLVIFVTIGDHFTTIYVY